MELVTGKPDFNFHVTVRRLYVEQRELTQPVTLSYPTFAAAAEASGRSRIWGGVHWPADNERGLELGRPADVEAALGLAVDLPPGGGGGWRSAAVDAMPAGAYELKLKAEATGDQLVRLKVAIEPSEKFEADSLAATQAIVPASSSDGVVTIPWTSDGVRSFRVSIEAHADGGGGGLLISAISASRVWPKVAGSPRYYEPSSAGHSEP
jgi:hypothetical protein